MRRSFDYDDENERQWGMDDYDEYEGEGMDGDDSHAKMVDMMQIELEGQHINSMTLRAALRLCERSSKWENYSVKTKLKQMKEVYLSLTSLVANNGSAPPKKDQK